MTLGAKLDINIFQAEASCLWAPSNRPQELIGYEFRSVIGDDLELLFPWIRLIGARLQLDHLFDSRVVSVHDHACLLVVLGHGLLDHGVEFSQEGVAPDEHMCLDADCVHHSSKLDCDVTGADKDHLLG